MMNDSPQPSLGPFGRYITFSGLGMALMAACTYFFRAIEQLSGDKAFPFVILGLGAASILLTLFFYDRCPKKLVIPLGIAGWAVTFLLLLLRSWI
ncbi:MAG TPA: hypothetical protein VKM56_13295 [Verrucomicrobiae bacterium]|nr:hypothetical protein [Verrucomicrobiae bacterium]